MLKRLSSLILVLVIGSSVLAGTVRPSYEHVCKMAGMEMTPGIHEMMPAASAFLIPPHKMMPGMQMPTASPPLSPSHEMMPGMQMPTASTSLSPSHEMMPGMQMMNHGTMDHGTMDHGEQTMPGMETMPCCQKHVTQPVSSKSGSSGECCVNIPQETGSSRTTFNLRLPSFSDAVIHPAIVQSPLAAPEPYECFYSTQLFLPNLQASYIRNHSFLI